MLIAFTGPQSSGKTTLIDALKVWAVANGREFSYKPSATRTLKAKGFTINNIGDDFNKTQKAVIDSHISNIEYYNGVGGDVVLDRCILDGVVYTKYFHNQGKVTDEIMSYANNAAQKYFPVYDIVFYLDPIGVPLVSDNERSVDVIFRRDIIQIFNDYIEIFPVVTLTGNIQDRLKLIIDHLNKYAPPK